MTTRPKLRVAVSIPGELAYGREVLRGVGRFALEHDWSLVHVPIYEGRLTDPRALGAQVLVTFLSTQEHWVEAAGWGVPMVNVSARMDPLTFEAALPCVLSDPLAAGRMAAEHLRQRGLTRLAYCGLPEHWYSIRRREGFLEVARETGDDDPPSSDAKFGIGGNKQAPLSAWLASLRKPVGVVACNDVRARHVAEACRELGLRVPQDVAIIGVDNDEMLCLGTDPPLSSVDPDAREVGYRAAGVLGAIWAGRGAATVGTVGTVEAVSFIVPRGVVPRASTQPLSSSDPEVEQALRFIHEHAAESIGVEHVAEAVAMSRRSLERRFKEASTVSVAGAIRRAHIERAKQLLLDTDLSLDQVARAAGFGYERQMRMVFHRDVGRPPSDFRKAFTGR